MSSVIRTHVHHICEEKLLVFLLLLLGLLELLLVRPELSDPVFAPPDDLADDLHSQEIHRDQKFIGALGKLVELMLCVDQATHV